MKMVKRKKKDWWRCVNKPINFFFIPLQKSKVKYIHVIYW